MTVLYVTNVAALRDFYGLHFGLQVQEEQQDTWAQLGTGSGASLGLHRIGNEYTPPDGLSVRYHSNCKLVFDVEQPLDHVRHQLLEAGVAMGDVQQWPGYAFRVCDGHDPEGNVFQLREKIAAGTAEG